MIDFKSMKRVGILYNPKTEQAVTFSSQVKTFMDSHNVEVWICSSWDEDTAKAKMAGSDLLISVGGDGTILRTVRVSIPHPIDRKSVV